MVEKLEHYFDRLWPLNRSLTGDGNRETVKILSEIVNLKVNEVPSGTKCYDWNVPPEWNVKEAWIKNSKGEKIVDFSKNNLHLLGYSIPFQGKLSFSELKEHLYTLPGQPTLVPYLCSYYKERWGFCISHNQYLDLNKEEIYEVCIDSKLDPNGSMTVAEAVIEGRSKQEIVFSTYICHPSMANNELSGPLVASFIYKKLKEQGNLKYTYRFIFVPETIGAIYILSQHGEHWKKNMHAGFVLTCVGDPGNFTYKKSRRGNSPSDRAALTVLNQTVDDFNLVEFFPNGSDERQYCSPGFNLPMGSLMRTMYAVYPEYHTSADNKELISFEAMEGTILKYLEIIELIERNERYINTMPHGEPQLGKRGLYPTFTQTGNDDHIRAMMWILNLADGEHDLISISERSKYPIKQLLPIVDTLLENGILKYEGQTE